MKGNKKHGTHGMRLRLALLAGLVVVSSVVMGTSFAKYMTSGSYAGNARVSPFVVASNSVGSTSLKLDAEAGKNSDSYPFSVTNSSDGVTCEVKTGYDIIVSLPERLNGEVKMVLLQDGRELPHPSVSEDGLTYRYEAGVFQAAQSETHHFELVFKADHGITKACEFNGIRVSAYAEQID